MSGVVPVTRRGFLKAGAGFVLGFQLVPELFGEPVAVASFSPNAFLAVHDDETVTVWVARSEMGQGVRTSLPMIVAEELEADWSRVRVEQAPLDEKYGEQLTGGSYSIRGSWETLRRAGATAREMLVAAAAREWRVDPSTCRAERGAVLHPPTRRRLTYGRLAAAAAALPVPAPETVRLKEPRTFRLVGTSVARVDGPAIVSGRAVYGADVRLPGMLFATVERCPVVGGKLASFDAKRAKAVPGVRHVIPLDNGGRTFGQAVWATGVAVVADSTWAALEGRRALDITWDDGPNGAMSSESIWRELKSAATAEGKTTHTAGDATAALAGAARTIEAVYEVPYLAHAPVETMNCVADVREDRCLVWAPTQNPAAIRQAAAQILGLAPEKVEVRVTLLGGGFGRRLYVDYAIEALQISKGAKAPVQLLFTREDDMRHGFLRPASLQILRAGLDAGGRPVAWTHRIVGPSRYASGGGPTTPGPEISETYAAQELPYAIPNLRVDYVQVQTPVPLGAWRSVTYSQNGFVSECFVDELAEAAGKDPYQFRRELLAARPPFTIAEKLVDTRRLLAVLDLAAQKSGWSSRLPAGRGRGIAVGTDHGGFVCHVAEVTAAPGGEVRVDRIVTAIDCGTVVNPDGVAAQIESAVAFALSGTLEGEITFERGRVRESSYRDFGVVRMRDMPAVEVHIVRSSEPPGGVGEPGVPPLAPAVANAIFAATGTRVRRLPIRR